MAGCGVPNHTISILNSHSPQRCPRTSYGSSHSFLEFHTDAYQEDVRGHESMYEHVVVNLTSEPDFLRFVEMFRQDSRDCLFAVIDTTRPDPNHPEWGEVEPAIVLHAFQRTHVGSHAAGLLLKYVHNLPPSGLGFRKVRWRAAPSNFRSHNLAKRMGIKMEGVIRWDYVRPVTEGCLKEGNEKAARAEDAGDGRPGRDSNEWALCWDDWDDGGRELVERILARIA